MDLRIWRHPILSFTRGRKVRIYFEGRIVEAYEGETLAAALYASGLRVFTWSSKLGRPRGLFCMIGKCSSCLMRVNGVPNVRACITPVKDGMVVERQKGLPELPETGSPLMDGSRQWEKIETDFLVVGGGPAGLAAAEVLSSYSSAEIVLVDSNPKLGGQLTKQTHKFFGSKDFFGGLRGFQIAERYLERIKSRRNVRLMPNTTVFGVFRGGLVAAVSQDKITVIKPRRVIVATGAVENYLAFPGNDLPGVMGAGAAQTLMNVYGVKPGDRALVVGAGNVGLIVAYQLLQAGVDVAAVVEVMKEIGGWLVHAAKLRRYGVPILTRHTIVRVYGKERVEGATIAQVDESFTPVKGSEKNVDCDVVLLAVGLTPDTRLVSQAGAVMKWVPEAGGLVPLRTQWLETSVPGLYIAGDSAGIEEATTAIIEGMIAAYSAALSLGISGREAEEGRKRLYDYLWNEYRSSPLLARARKGKLKATVSEGEMDEIRRVNPPPIVFK